MEGREHRTMEDYVGRLERDGRWGGAGGRYGGGGGYGEQHALADLRARLGGGGPGDRQAGPAHVAKVEAVVVGEMLDAVETAVHVCRRPVRGHAEVYTWARGRACAGGWA
jgi:hypothetical protein